MHQLTIGENDAGRRADRFIARTFPHWPLSLIAKSLRTKKIKRNNARLEGSDRLEVGDVLTFYMPDDLFVPAEEKKAHHFAAPKLTGIIYEDENLLIVNKKPGLVVHMDESGHPDTLIARIQSYLYKKGEWDPDLENSFAPALCNRIDRNTGGLVIAAKNAKTLRDMNEIIKTRQVDKYYLCLVMGHPVPAEGILRHYLVKNEKTKEVAVFPYPRKDSKPAETHYKVLQKIGGKALVECQLVTGRTHQIRAQMAFAGWPLAGDAKYGRKEKRRTGQALWAYKLDFSNLQDGKSLSYLKGRVFIVPKEERGNDFSDF